MHAASEECHCFYILLICSLLFAGCIGIPTTEGSSLGTFVHLTDRQIGATNKSSVKKSSASISTTTSICLLSKEGGTCNDKVQRFYFDATVGCCVGFIYTGCGGNENRFETREDCEERCMNGLKSSPCANSYSIPHMRTNFDGKLSCSNRRCGDGFICVTDERSISQCCNQTIEQSYAAARSSFCVHSQRSLRSVITHSEVLFGRDCSDLLCTNGFECIQINTLFVKCCQRDHAGQMPSAKPPLMIEKEKRARSILNSSGQIQQQNPRIGKKNFKSPCAMPKHEGNCSGDYKRMAQVFFYDPDWQSCFAFKYTGCGGNANRFITIDDCESKCLYADGSVCKGPLPSIEPTSQDPPCADNLCPEGYTCSYGFGYMECCNSTIQQYASEAYSSTCPDGSLADGINDDYFMAIFAKSCSDLVCDTPRRCVQVSPYFAKCCGIAPIPPQPHAPPTIENGHRSHGSLLDISPGTLDGNGIESHSGMVDSDAGSMPYAK
uniref:Major allergen Ani s 1 n=1 Tax=Ascaris suum TaxID=6253 RepID=F1L0W2_ASCSU